MVFGCRVPLLYLFHDTGADLKELDLDFDRNERIALITVTFNSAIVLDDFLASLNHQSSENWDLIVVDNASTDSSVEQIEGWGGRLHMLLRNTQNLGFGVAMNQGVQAALDAGYGAVIIINNDVLFGPDFLTQLINSPARDGVCVVAPVIRYAGRTDRYWYAGGRFTWMRGAFQAQMDEHLPPGGQHEWRTTFAPGCCLLIERATLEWIGLFDEQFFVYWEDVDWAYRCLKAGQPITVVREPTLEHKVSVLTGGGTSAFGARMFHEGQIRFLRKHFPRWVRAIQYPLVLAKIVLRCATRRDDWADTRLRLKAVDVSRNFAIPCVPPCIAVNLTAVGPVMVGGTARYAVSLFEAMADRVAVGKGRIYLEGHVRPDAIQHFTPSARRFLHPVPHLKVRIARIIYERLFLPLRLRIRGTYAVINPIFSGPTRGAQRAVTIIHDLYFRNAPHLVNPRRRRYLEMVVPRAVRASSVVVAISESTANEVRSAWPDVADRTVVVHSAGRKLPSGPPLEARSPYVLFVGAALPNKNVTTIVDAIGRLQARGRDIELLHVGSDPEGLLERAVKKYDADGFVRTLRGGTDAELAAAYRGAVALVIASVTEGFCLPVLEAQEIGTPVCTTPCGALQEIAGEGALYYQPDQPDALAGHLAFLLDHPNKREALVEAGRRNSERFDWQQTAVKILEQAVGGRLVL